MHTCTRLFPADCVAKTDVVLSVLQHFPIMDSDRTSNMPSVPPLRTYSTHPLVRAMKTFLGGLQYDSPLTPKSLKISLRNRGTPHKVQRRPKAKYHKICRRATVSIHYLTTGPEEQCTAQFYWAVASVSEFACMEKEILHPSTKGKPMGRQ